MRKAVATIGLVFLSVVVLLATSASDNFNRADSGTMGTNWIARNSSWGIISNKAYRDLFFVNDEFTSWNPSTNTFGNDQYSQVTCSGMTAGHYCGVAVRLSGTTYANSTYYGSRIDTSSWYITNITGGNAGSVIASGSGTFADGDVIRLDATGTTLTLTQNGSTLGTATDSDYASGQPGLATYDTADPSAIRFEDWSAADAAPPPSTFPPGIINNPIRCCNSVHVDFRGRR